MKRVLVVYHSFDEWEMGPIRLRRIVRHLSRHGYEPVVLTSTANSRSTAIIPSGIEILRVESLDLAELYRRVKRPGSPSTTQPAPPISRSIGLTSAINRWLMVPDKQIPWRQPAIKKANAYLARHPVDVIFGSLAPRTNLLVARALARRHRLPCVQEFRDLWTGSPYYHLAQPTALHRWLHARLERAIIRDATKVTAVCRGLAQHIQQQYQEELHSPVALNYNFYDPEELAELPKRTGDPHAPLVISYVGAMYTSRNPFVFFEGMRKFIDQFQIQPREFRFRWVGSVLGVPQIEAMIERLRLKDFIDLEGQRSHHDALHILRDSDASLIIQAPGDQVHIPGKLFEAMGAEVPVLTLSEPCEVTDIIEQTSAGLVCSHDAAGVCDLLQQFRVMKLSGQPWRYQEQERIRYSADAAVGGLARLFDEAIVSFRGM